MSWYDLKKGAPEGVSQMDSLGHGLICGPAMERRLSGKGAFPPWLCQSGLPDTCGEK